MIQITDEMCRRAVYAMQTDRIQGFSTPQEGGGKWGPPYYILDVWKQPGEQEIWRGDNKDEMIERCKIEQMRLALQAND
jgi:hypothetical protein